MGGSFSTTIGDGSSNPITVTHNLGSTDIFVSVHEISTGNLVDAAIVVTNSNNISLTFAVIPTSNQYRVSVGLGGVGASGAVGVYGGPITEYDYTTNITVPDTGRLAQPTQLTLAGSEQAIVAGTGQITIADAPTDIDSWGRADQESFIYPGDTVQPDKFLNIYDQLTLNGKEQMTLLGNAFIRVDSCKQLPTRQFYFSTPPDPVGCSTVGGLMMGLAGRITPALSGQVFIILTGIMFNPTAGAGDGTALDIHVGTGPAPRNQDAITGVQVGGTPAGTEAAALANILIPFCACGVATMQIGVSYWIDVVVAAVVAGTGTVKNLTLVAFEL